MNKIIVTTSFYRQNLSPRNRFARKIRWPMTMIFLGTLHLTLFPGQAIAINLPVRASFTHSVRGGETQEQKQNLSQRYSTSFNSRPTDAISINGAMGYNKSWQEGGGSRASLQQSAGLRITNDIFSAQLNGNAGFQMPSKSVDSQNLGWRGSLTSNVIRKFLPSLRINYGQNFTTNDAIPRTTDSKSQRAGFATGLDHKLGHISYHYNTITSTNNISRSETRKFNHTASFSTRKSFWENRVNLRFSQGYSQSSVDTTRYIQPSGLVDLPIRATVVTSTIDDTPLFDPLPATPTLADDDLATQAIAINTGDVYNIGFTSNELAANRIYLYLDPTVTIDAGDAATLRFSLYTSPKTDGNTWTKVVPNLTPTFDNQDHRYILDYNFNFDTTIFKLVATNWPTAMIPITELQIISRQPGASIPLEVQKKNSSTSTSLGTTILLYKDIPLNYSFSLSTSKNPAGTRSKSSTQAGNLNLHWNLNKYCQPSLTMNTSTSQSNSQAKSTNRSLGLTVTSSPLPTVHINFGSTQNDYFYDSVKKSSTTLYNIFIRAALYPDLSTSLSLKRSESRSLQRNSSSTALNSDFSITARLSSKLTSSLSTSYSKQSSTSGARESSSKTKKSGAFAMNIRPSDILSLQLHASKEWNDKPTPVYYNLNASVALLQTRKTQVTTRYTFTTNGTSSTSSYHASWSWTLSRHLSLRTNGSLTKTTTQRWNIQSLITTTF